MAGVASQSVKKLISGSPMFVVLLELVLDLAVFPATIGQALLAYGVLGTRLTISLQEVVLQPRVGTM
jgi:hypothetical protein